jgi:hypothetical protein
MRTILLAGAAVLTLGTFGSTAANAGGLWIAKHLQWDCKSEVSHTSPQANCSRNFVSDWGWSNDDNTQKVKQSNKAFLWGTDPDDLKQRNIGVNVVVKGDDNYQSIKQSNKAGAIYSDDVEQKNTAANVVDHGDDNTQKIKQSNSALALGTDEDVEQKNHAVNYVGKGDDNYQSIEQSNSLVAIGSPSL